MATQELLATLEKLNTSINAHGAQYRSGKTNSAKTLSILKRRIRQKVNILEELRSRGIEVAR